MGIYDKYPEKFYFSPHPLKIGRYVSESIIFLSLLVCLCYRLRFMLPLLYTTSRSFFSTLSATSFPVFFTFQTRFFIPSPGLSLPACQPWHIPLSSQSLLSVPFFLLLSFPSFQSSLAETVDATEETRSADVYFAIYSHELFTSVYHAMHWKS